MYGHLTSSAGFIAFTTLFYNLGSSLTVWGIRLGFRTKALIGMGSGECIRSLKVLAVQGHMCANDQQRNSHAQRNRFRTSLEPPHGSFEDVLPGNIRNTSLSNVLLFMTAVYVNYVNSETSLHFCDTRQMTQSSEGWEQIFSNMLPLGAPAAPVSGGLLHRELLPLQDLMWVLLILLHGGKPWRCRLSLSLLTVSTQTHHRSHNASVLQTQWNDTDRLPPHTGKWFRENISTSCSCFKQWLDDKDVHCPRCKAHKSPPR